MSASLVAPTFALRSSLFGIVAGAHFALLLMLAVVKVAAPVSDEHTIAAEILPMAGGGAVARDGAAGLGQVAGSSWPDRLPHPLCVHLQCHGWFGALWA